VTLLGTCIMQAHGSATFVAAVKLLLAHGADVAARFEFAGMGAPVVCASALDWVAKYPEPYWQMATGTHAADVIAALLAAGADANAANDEGVTPLALLGAMAPCPAVLAAMRVLIAQGGADVAAKAADGVSVADGAFGDNMRNMLVELGKLAA
jgi:ankyrin repeat protein